MKKLTEEMLVLGARKGLCKANGIREEVMLEGGIRAVQKLNRSKEQLIISHTYRIEVKSHNLIRIHGMRRKKGGK